MSLVVNAIKLTSELSADPWAAGEALREAMTEVLYAERAVWVQRGIEQGESPHRAWAAFHEHSAQFPDMFPTKASAQMVLHRGRIYAMIFGPRRTLDHLIDSGLGADASADSRTGDGHIKTWEAILDQQGEIPATIGLGVSARIDLLSGLSVNPKTQSWSSSIPEHLERWAPQD